MERLSRLVGVSRVRVGSHRDRDLLSEIDWVCGKEHKGTDFYDSNHLYRNSTVPLCAGHKGASCLFCFVLLLQGFRS